MDNINIADTFNVSEYARDIIAPKYFNFDDDELYRAGTFGYLTELFSTGVNLSAYALMETFNEIFPNTCKLPKSIMRYASLAKADGIYSVPAVMGMILTINESEIKNYKTLAENEIGTYTIPRDSVINIEGYNFSLDYDIIVSFKNVSGEYVYSAEYDMNDINNLSSIEVPYLKVAKVEDYDLSMLYIYADTRQLTRQYKYKTITSNNTIENISHTFEFDGQLSDFNVYYKTSTADDYTFITKYLEGSNVTLGEDFCLYRINGENSIEIIFKSLSGYFTPEFNSELKIEIITSLGESGVFTYTGESITFSYPSDYDIDMIPITCVSTGDSTGGVDSKSLTELKDYVAQTFSTRNTIISEADLLTYYNKIASFGNSELRFSKYADDVLRREYLAHLLLKNNDGTIIPTNTLNSIVDSYDTSNSYTDILLSNRIFKYDPINKRTELMPTDYDLDSVDDKSEFVYRNPFMLLMNKSPNLLNVLIDNYSKDIDLDFEYNNTNSILKFISSDLKIERDPFVSNNINMSVDIRQSIFTEYNIVTVDEETGNFTDNDYLRTYIALYNDNDDMIGYGRMTMTDIDTSIYSYTFKIELENVNSLTIDKINITSPLMEPNTNTISPIDVELYDVKARIFTFIKDDSIQYSSTLSNKMVIDPTYSLTNTYFNTSNSFDLFDNVTDIIKVEFKNTKLTAESDVVQLIKNLPLIRAKYIRDSNSHMEVLNLIDTKRQELLIAKQYTQENYNILMKLFNTYGPASFYKSRDGLIDRLNISIKLRVRLSSNSTTSLDSIKAYVNTYIQTMNSSSMDILYMNKLLSALQEEFNEIEGIEFVGYNDYDASIQTIETDDDFVESVGAIPEYISAHLLISDDDVSPDITIELF